MGSFLAQDLRELSGNRVVPVTSPKIALMAPVDQDAHVAEDDEDALAVLLVADVEEVIFPIEDGVLGIRLGLCLSTRGLLGGHGSSLR